MVTGALERAVGAALVLPAPVPVPAVLPQALATSPPREAVATIQRRRVIVCLFIVILFLRCGVMGGV